MFSVLWEHVKHWVHALCGSAGYHGRVLRRYAAHMQSRRDAAMQQADGSSAASGGQHTLPKGGQDVYTSYNAGHSAPKAEV